MEIGGSLAWDNGEALRKSVNMDLVNMVSVGFVIFSLLTG